MKYKPIECSHDAILRILRKVTELFRSPVDGEPPKIRKSNSYSRGHQQPIIKKQQKPLQMLNRHWSIVDIDAHLHMAISQIRYLYYNDCIYTRI